MAIITTQQKQIVLSIFLGICIIFFQNCSKTYGPKPFTKAFSKGITQDNVTVFAHELSGQESDHYFNVNLADACNTVVSSARPGYQIIHLTIENKSQDFYFLPNNFLTNDLVSIQEINEHIRTVNVPTIVYSEGAIYEGYALQQRIWRDLGNKMLHAGQAPIISPYNKLDKLLFIARESALTNLSVPLINYRTGHEKSFTIDMP